MDLSKGDHGTVPVVRIVADVEGGFTEINKSDYDPKKHTLYEEESAPAPAAINYAKMNKSDLSKALAAGGVKHDESMSKADLVALAEEHLAK